MPESPSPWRTWHYRLIWIITLASLLFNVLLLAGFFAFRLRAQREVANVSKTLNAIEINNLELPIHVDQQLSISMTVPFSDTFFVPISTTVPISTAVPFQDMIDVPINTIIPVNTTVNVPLAGLGSIPVPIVTDIPINLNVTVPISRNVRVQTTVPINLEVHVPIQSDIPIQTEVPVVMDFPVTIPLDQLGFNVLLEQVKEALNLLARVLGADTTSSTP